MPAPDAGLGRLAIGFVRSRLESALLADAANSSPTLDCRRAPAGKGCPVTWQRIGTALAFTPSR